MHACILALHTFFSRETLKEGTHNIFRRTHRVGTHNLKLFVYDLITRASPRGAFAPKKKPRLEEVKEEGEKTTVENGDKTRERCIENTERKMRQNTVGVEEKTVKKESMLKEKTK